MKRLLIALGCLTVPVSLFPFPGLSAQKRAITIDDYLALKSVGNPQLSPDGKWVAYTVTEQSLKDNRGITRIWLADVASGAVRQLTAGPGSDRQPRWSPDGRTVAFVSTRENGAQLWVLPIAGGEARRVTSLADGVFDPLWLPDGTGLIVTSDIKWPAQQEIDRATTTSRPTRASGPVSCGGTGTTGAPASASTCSPSRSPTAAPGT